MSEWWRGNRSFVVLLPAFRSWCCAVRSCSAFLLEYSLRRSHVCDGARSLSESSSTTSARSTSAEVRGAISRRNLRALSLAVRTSVKQARKISPFISTRSVPFGGGLVPACYRVLSSFVERAIPHHQYRPPAPHRTFPPSCTLSDTNVHLSGVKPLNRSDFLGSGGFSAQGSAVLRFRYPPRFAPLSPPTYEATTARASSSRPVDEQFTAGWLSVFASISDRRARSGLAGLWAYHNLFPGISRVGHTRRTPSSPSWPGLLKLSWYPC